MDCCNYVQPYAGAGHFYQQHHFSYENMNAYAAYNTAPVSNAIEANVRYNRLPPAYPTDYVYNPKEARLRKAMREQSRELSRQSILQTTGAVTGSGSGTLPGGNGGGGGGGGGNMSVSSSGNFLNHSMACASPNVAVAAASSLPGSPSINANRIISPWFPVGHGAPTSHLKPILTPRALAAHQRTLDKTKDVIRKQIECGPPGGFPGPVYGEFGSHGPTASGNPNTNQDGNDYCVMGEFPEGQKWYPYQNGTNAYHTRVAPASKITNLHRNMQNSNPHPGHWTQFCGVPLSQNAMIRGPRHMVFIPDQQNHCIFPDEMQLPYGSNKIDINHRLHSSYRQTDHQEKMISSPVSMQQISDEEKCNDDGPKWSTTTSASGPSESSTNLISKSSKSSSDTFSTKEEQENHNQIETNSTQQYVERVEVKHQKMNCKQPLPGFHQAFGSTEIGRFSRSEFFSNMVGESSNATLIPENFMTTPVYPFSPKSQNGNGSSKNSRNGEVLQRIMAEDCYYIIPTFSTSNSSENSTKYAAIMDCRNGLSQEWIEPVQPQNVQIAYLNNSPTFLLHKGNIGNSTNNCTSCQCNKLNENHENNSDSEGLDLRVTESSKNQKTDSKDDL